jgi:uncharacterized protein (TIGR02594 family)
MKAPQNVTPEDIRKDPKTYPPNKDGSIGPIILPDGRSKMIPAAEKMSYAPETGGETAAQDAIQSALQNTARGAMAKLQKTSLGPPEEAGTPAAHTPSDAAMGGGNAAPMGRNALLTPETNKGGSPIEIASQFLGKNERANRAELAAFFDKAGGPHLDPVKTAWCARFVNSVLATAGIQGTGSDMARSFLRVGTPIRPQDATAGDVIVFPRGTRGTYGHVGFVKDINVKENTVTVISGNTAGGVRVNEYPLSRALGIRRIQQQHVGAEIPGVTDQTATA